MKRKLFTVLMLASLLTVIGCGKDNSSGGGGTPGIYNPILDGGLSNSGQQAYQNLVNWYNNPSLQGYPGNETGKIFEARTVTTCESFIGGLLSLCTPRYDDKEITIQANQSKATNTKLAQVFQKPSGYELVKATQMGTFFVVEYRNIWNGHFKEFTIDTNKHSAVNPVKIIDTEGKRQEQHQRLEFYPYIGL